ncbi:MAG: TetR/AcrR family transcriptional regulator [Ilumatobacter sp.]|nr:TetR/AcrR family transcriptional regulator [Ilumatobacter sp.]
MARSGRRRGSGADTLATRQAIIEATIAELAESGFSATSARAVALRAGVAPGGVFYHFGSMDDLLGDVFDRCHSARLDRLRAALDGPAEAWPAQLARATRAEFESAESRALLELVVGSIGSPTLGSRIREGIAESVEFTRGVLGEVLDGSTLGAAVPLDLASEVAASAFFGLEVLGHVGHDVDLDGLASIVEMLLALLTGRAAPA